MNRTWFAVIVISLVLLLVLFLVRWAIVYVRTKKAVRELTLPEENDQQSTPLPKTVEINFQERLKNGLSKTRNDIWGKISGLFGKEIDHHTIDELEELLYGADLGPKVVTELMELLQSEYKKGAIGEGPNQTPIKTFLYQYLFEKISPYDQGKPTYLFPQSPFVPGQNGLKVILIVGVNGAGKTTTIGKLATKLRASGAQVVVGACDTFRAAAVDQLQVWCDRSGATMVRAELGTNPTGVAYESLQKALALGADYCILDTAGRLHTKDNLMEELKKTKNVLKKLDPNAPHETLLVIDAISGQNALNQAEEFHRTLNLTGLIFTKCDGSSKAGSAIPIVQSLKVPIVYIGVGETEKDLDEFRLNDFLKSMLYE